MRLKIRLAIKEHSGIQKKIKIVRFVFKVL